MATAKTSTGSSGRQRRKTHTTTRASSIVRDLTDDEEALIQASIANDPDNPELTAGQFARMRPASEVLPPTLYAKLVARGRPKLATPKVPVTLRLDPEIVAAFKSTGRGWQTRINDVLRQQMPKIAASSIDKSIEL